MFSRFNRSIFLFIRGVEASGAKRFTSTSATQECILNSSIEQGSSEEFSERAVEQNGKKSVKGVPLTVEEFKDLKRLKPCQPENPHLLKVTILGEPNVGKSTLTNKLVKWKVCAVSRKVHTTRKKAVAVFVENNKQIVFLDTPGFVSPEISKKHSLEPSFVMDPVRSIHESDLIAVVIDIANKWTNNRINEEVLKILESFRQKKSILILNKVDSMKSKGRILDLTRILTGGVIGGIKIPIFDSKPGRNLPIEEIAQLIKHSPEKICDSDVDEDCRRKKDEYRGWTSFARVFMVSALKNNGIDELREYLVNEALPREWMYHDSMITDQHPHEIALMIVREKLLEYLPEEIPYHVDLRISKWELLSTGCPKINISIVCSNTRHKRFVIGPGGKHITACVEKSRLSMREAFRRDVVLHIGVA